MEEACPTSRGGPSKPQRPSWTSTAHPASSHVPREGPSSRGMSTYPYPGHHAALKRLGSLLWIEAERYSSRIMILKVQVLEHCPDDDIMGGGGPSGWEARVPGLYSARDGDLGSVCHRNGAEGRSVELLTNVQSTAVPPVPHHLGGTSCPGCRAQGLLRAGGRRTPPAPPGGRLVSPPPELPVRRTHLSLLLKNILKAKFSFQTKTLKWVLGNLFITIHFICQVILNTKKKGPPASPDCPPG